MTTIARRALGAAAITLLATPAVPRAQGAVTLRLGWTSGDGAQDPYAVGARASSRRRWKRAWATAWMCSCVPTARSAMNDR